MTTSDERPGKAAVSIKEMAARVGLSRQRFMQLVKAGVMPPPLRDEGSGRPYYPEGLQARCEEVRRRNVGVNGKVVLFYARRTPPPAAGLKTVGAAGKPKVAPEHAGIVDGLHGLGLTSATAAQVADAVAALYPHGTAGVEAGAVVRAVFLHLRCKNSSEKAGGKQ